MSVKLKGALLQVCPSCGRTVHRRAGNRRYRTGCCNAISRNETLWEQSRRVEAQRQFVADAREKLAIRRWLAAP